MISSENPKNESKFVRPPKSHSHVDVKPAGYWSYQVQLSEIVTTTEQTQAAAMSHNRLSCRKPQTIRRLQLSNISAINAMHHCVVLTY